VTADDAFDELDDELRARTDDDVRRESAEAAADAELLRRRQRSFAEVHLEAMARGDRVLLTVTGRWAIAGDLVGVGTDFVTVGDGYTEADVVLSAAVTRFERASRGGRSNTGGSRTLMARLREYEATGEPLILRTSDGAEIHGSVSLVAGDHLLMTDDGGEEHALPTASVAMVVRRSRPR
jgi:hypothetical protein